MANSFGDFWRTVWDQGVCVIVMVTNMVEGGRVGRNAKKESIRSLSNKSTETLYQDDLHQIINFCATDQF